MGLKGPIPKHSSERVRRNQDEGPIDTITTIGPPVKVPTLGISNAHPIVKQLYQSMKDSAQAKFFEPTDWSYAKLTLMFLNDYLNQSKPSAMMIASLDSMLSKLLLTEGDRRRVRIEVERQQAEGTVLDVAALFRERMQAGQS